MTATGGGVLGRVALVTAAVVVVLVVLIPVLFIWWLSSPAPTPSAEDAGVMTQLRDVASALRERKVRLAVDRGADVPAVARLIDSDSLTRRQLAGAADPGAGRLVLIGVRTTESTGVAVDLVQSSVPTGQSSALFARESRPWVGCYRVELPVLAIDATMWTARDSTCPTFSAALQHAGRVHVDGATAVPLLRPPCYGTTGYCPGG